MNNILYEESGSLKVGTVITRNEGSLQIDTQYGKRIKIKNGNVLLSFSSAIQNFLPNAEDLAKDIDIDFLWKVCDENEFDFQQIAEEYFGHPPSAEENAAILIRLFSAPMYFYKKGKGRFKAAPEESLRAALAGQERKKREQKKIESWIEEMTAGHLPDEIRTQSLSLLHRPDKQSLAYKALDATCQKTALAPLQLISNLGGIPSITEYLLNCFMMDYFPQGRGFPTLSEVIFPSELPEATVKAFSIDDCNTTEIDDALSLTPTGNGHYKVGIHIAAPTLGIPIGSDIEKQVFKRLSTVYFPGDKITMLPENIIQQFTLQEGYRAPALSMYIDVSPDMSITGITSQLECVPIAANLRHHQLEPVFNTETLALPNHGPDYPYKHELVWLWQFSDALEKRRGKHNPNRPVQYDHNVEVDENGHVSIITRARGTPMDKLVSELMILANSEWGRMLAEAKIPGIYRAQQMGKVKMTTHPEPHVGLGVAQYAWCTSPLRRAADFINQRQLIAMLRNEPPAFKQKDAMLFALMRDFSLTYNAYFAFQTQMEHYWCLKWFQQENIHEITARYLKDNMIQITSVPMRVKVSGLPTLNRGDIVRLAIIRIAELTQSIELKFISLEHPADSTPSEPEIDEEITDIEPESQTQPTIKVL